jgi:hypothetical protein
LRRSSASLTSLSRPGAMVLISWLL